PEPAARRGGPGAQPARARRDTVMTTDVRALHVVAAAAGSQAVHVFGDRVVDAEACRWAQPIDVAFLAEAGWDAGIQVLRPPADHPLLGRPVCQVPGCEV